MKRTVTYDGYSNEDLSAKRVRYGTYKKRIRKVQRPARLSSAAERQIQAMISRSRETKYKTTSGIELSMTTNWISPYVYPIAMSPAQGSASDQRIGNKINPVGIKFNAVLHNNSSQNVMVRMLLLSVHDGKTDDADITNTLFEGFSAQDVSPTPSMISLIRKVNREEFKVLRDVVLTLGYDAAGYASPNSRAQVYKEYIKLGGTQTFHDTNQEYPENDRVVCVVMPLRADGDENLGETVEISYTSDFYYKD